MKLLADMFADLQVLMHVPFIATADRAVTEGQRWLWIPKPPYASSSVELAPSHIAMQQSYGC